MAARWPIRSEHIEEIEIGTHQRVIAAEASTVACGATPAHMNRSPGLPLTHWGRNRTTDPSTRAAAAQNPHFLPVVANQLIWDIVSMGKQLIRARAEGKILTLMMLTRSSA
jgi:hypothetical protein